VHGAGGQHEHAGAAQGAGALLDALEQFLAVARALALGRDGDGGHFCGLGFQIGVQGGAAEDHAIVLDHGVAGNVALDLGAVALDQGAVFLERLDQLDDAAHIVDGGFAQLFELFVDHHGADAVVHIDFQQQRAVHRKRQDVAAFHAMFAGAHAVLQVKAGVGGHLRRGQLGQQLAGGGQRQLGVDGVVFAVGLGRVHADAGHLAQEDQLVGLHLAGHAGGDFFHAQVEGLAGGREAKR